MRLCLLAFILVLALTSFAGFSKADFPVFDETVVYTSGYALGTISFAANGTLFSNAEWNIMKLVDGNVSSVGDVRSYKDPSEEYHGIAVAPNGTLCISVNNDTSGRIYRVVNGKISKDTVVCKRNGKIKELAFRPDGELFFTNGTSVFNIAQSEVFNSSDMWKGGISISSIAFAQDSTFFESVQTGYGYDLILKLVDDVWSLVYARSSNLYPGGIDTIAISPTGDVYFEDVGRDLGYGNLYKLIPKTELPVRDGNLFLTSVFPMVTNSSILHYAYNSTAGELRLNLTGTAGTNGALVIVVFGLDHSVYLHDLVIEAKLNGQAINYTITKSLDNYVYLTYKHQGALHLSIKSTYKLIVSPPTEPIWIVLTLFVLFFGIGALIYFTTHKRRSIKNQRPTTAGQTSERFSCSRTTAHAQTDRI